MSQAKRSVQHGDFTLERNYPVPPARVYAAWADPQLKAQWFTGPGDQIKPIREVDFRVGGREKVITGAPGDVPHVFDAIYQDIVPDERIIYAYTMALGDKRISASVATVQFLRDGTGTKMTFTEQAVYLDGTEYGHQSRLDGTNTLLDNIGNTLRS